MFFLEFTKHSGIFTLLVKQKLAVSVEDAWSFFSDPGNLKVITPEKMGFKITSPFESKMYEGQIITYKVGIFPFFKSSWVTEITHIKANEYFVDEQRSGPYKIWHHEHHFRKLDVGTEMTDRITFAIPFGFIGNIAYHMIVKRQLKKIFDYRREVLNTIRIQ